MTSKDEIWTCVLMLTAADNQVKISVNQLLVVTITRVRGVTMSCILEHSSAAQANILRNQFIPTTNGNNPVFYLYFYAVFECSTFCENAPVILDLSLPLLNGKVYNMHVFKCKKDRLSLKGSRWHVCDFERRKKDFSFPDSQAALSLHLHIYYSYPPQDHNVPEAMPAVLWHHTCKCAQQHKTFCPCC